MTAFSGQSDSSPTGGCVAGANVFAFATALAGAAGSVYLSAGLGLKACPLCFYQRSFAIAAALVIGMTLLLDGCRSARAGLLALPLASTGLGVALFHVNLVMAGKLECPPALLGWGDGPTQSLLIFAALTIACVIGAWSGRRSESGGSVTAILGAVILGVGASWACIVSAPPLPPAPSQAYDPVKQPFDMCRPPYRGD